MVIQEKKMAAEVFAAAGLNPDLFRVKKEPEAPLASMEDISIQATPMSTPAQTPGGSPRS